LQEEVARYLASLRGLPDFREDADFSDINVCATDGDNALHVAFHQGNWAMAKALVQAGIDINKAGDLGYTPLHVACMKGNIEMVQFLVDHGADLFALSEGDPPFYSARLAGHNAICDLLGSLMTRAQSRDPNVWIRARIARLRREIASLEAELASSDSMD
jgi:ankyrin repeat protein